MVSLKKKVLLLRGHRARVRHALKKKSKSKRLRLCVFRSSKHIYAQVIDDRAMETRACCSTLEKAIRESCKSTGSKEAAMLVGKGVAVEAKKKKITEIVFDRGGYRYHGRVKALAEAARAEGLKF